MGKFHTTNNFTDLTVDPSHRGLVRLQYSMFENLMCRDKTKKYFFEDGLVHTRHFDSGTAMHSCVSPPPFPQPTSELPCSFFFNDCSQPLSNTPILSIDMIGDIPIYNIKLTNKFILAVLQRAVVQ